MLWLYLQAPFAACRPFVAGWYRPTAEFLTPSAVYGLLLNVAGIDSRLCEHEEGHDGKTPATLMRDGLPPVKLALGVPAGIEPPKTQTVYQQLHNYPVGAGGISKELAMGRKNNIAPVRREILCDVHAVVVVREAGDGVIDGIREGLSGNRNAGRYGVPFLGDNSFLLDRLEEITPRPARWYTRFDRESSGPPAPGTTRLTYWIDRANMSRTKSALYAPSIDATTNPPEVAWTEIRPPQR